MTFLNVPNTLTLLRILTIPFIVSMLVKGRYKAALFLFIFASVTDVLDGLVARIAKQQTKLGRFLDPMADKLLLVTSFVTFAVYGWVPMWLTVSFILRDVMVVIGWVGFYLLHKFIFIRPSILGKTAIAMQMTLCAFILIKLNFRDVMPDAYVFIWITLACTIISGLHYYYQGFTYKRG
ncbi:MAG: CDP-alcohol phosphatidyltransferase family protein [Nitrospirae bacterium]|nr:CDP-alcohol phosphatidyltransferase family protein [Nitrospirota bacterium]